MMMSHFPTAFMVMQKVSEMQVLIGCIPNSAALCEGRLGSPLSEDPEFWRAAPESALDWGVDEFDLPPPVPSTRPCPRRTCTDSSTRHA